MKKKIIHIISGLKVGGTENMLLRTLPALQDSFINTVCCISKKGRGTIGDKLEQAGIKVFYLDMVHPLDPAGIKSFKRIIVDLKPNLMVTYLIHADLLGRILGRLWGVKTIICNQRGSLLNWEFLRIADRMTKNLVTKYVVQTKVARAKLMRTLNLSEKKFIVISNGIDPEKFDLVVNRDKKIKDLKIRPGNFNIVCVAKLRHGKGHQYLLEALERIYDQYPNLNLLILGDGEEEIKLKRQIINYRSRPNIHFLGLRDDVAEILSISDIFILPTLYEGMSNAILEAMAAGLPIITTDIPENREIIRHKVDGLLVEPKNYRKLATAMTWLLANPILSKRLAESALQTVEKKFSLENNIKQMKKILMSI